MLTTKRQCNARERVVLSCWIEALLCVVFTFVILMSLFSHKIDMFIFFKLDALVSPPRLNVFSFKRSARKSIAICTDRKGFPQFCDCTVQKAAFSSFWCQWIVVFNSFLWNVKCATFCGVICEHRFIHWNWRTKTNAVREGTAIISPQTWI